MTWIIEVIYDGEVLWPCNPIKLKKNNHYKISIEIEEKKENEDAWNILKNMAGSIDGPEDWAEELDHYLNGTPKKAVLLCQQP